MWRKQELLGIKAMSRSKLHLHKGAISKPFDVDLAASR